MATLGLTWLALACVGWLLRRQTLIARGWNPRRSWEENVFSVEGFYIFSGLLGLGLVLAEVVETLVLRDYILAPTFGWVGLIMGAMTMTAAIQHARRRRKPPVWQSGIILGAWAAFSCLAIMSHDTGPRHTPWTAIALAGGILSVCGVFLSLLSIVIHTAQTKKHASTR